MSSSDYFGDDDPDFLEYISTTNFPGDEVMEGVEQAGPSTPKKRKRSRSPSFNLLQEDEDEEFPSSPSKAPVSAPSYTDAEAYGVTKFGGWGDYMRKKRAKLQIQNSEITAEGAETKPQIFKGLQIYINGWTDPPLQDLRKMITEHGGIFHAYLDRKGLVTHILSNELTLAKIKEFSKMKVVRPSWIIESVEKQTLLRWQNFILLPGQTSRVDASGAKATQKSLFAFQSPGKASTSVAKPEPLSLPNSGAGEITEDVVPLILVVSPAEARDEPVYLTDPLTFEQAAQMPSYAVHKSNPSASRLMQSKEWRAAHTSVANDFVEKYFKNSRLHHLSTWKEELKVLVRKAKEGDEKQSSGEQAKDSVSMKGSDIKLRLPSPLKAKGKGKQSDNEGRVIMHCDFDSFFVSAGLIGRPELKGKPVVVCHANSGEGVGESSTSEIASSSYEARAAGVKNGMSLGQARQLCPGVVPIPYEFERYRTFSLQFYNILLSFADDIQVVSVDEALLDVSEKVAKAAQLAAEDGTGDGGRDFAKELAEAIRAEVRNQTGCEISIGISHNILLARLATRAAKPAKSFHLLPDQVSTHISPLDIRDLPGVGYSIRDKIETKFGVRTCGEVRDKISKEALQKTLGDGIGAKMWDSVRGIDHSPLGVEQKRKSVSAEVNYGIRFQSAEDARSFMHNLAQEVGRRLDADKLKGRSLTLKILKRHPDAPTEAAKFLGHGICETFNKSIAIGEPGGRATANRDIIRDQAMKLLNSWGFDPKELRGVGIQIQKLEEPRGNVKDGQGLLAFKPAGDTKKESPKIELAAKAKAAQPPPKPPAFDIPTASQIDPEFLAALPEDIRKELLEATKQAARNDAGGEAPVAGPSKKAPPPDDAVRREESPEIMEIEAEHWKPTTSRNSTTPAPRPEPTTSSKDKTKTRTDVRHITKQLAPKHPKPISPSKSNLFTRREPAKVEVSETELQQLGIDLEFFAALPPDIQRDQLAMARQAKKQAGANKGFLEPPAPDRASRSRSRSVSVAVTFGPAPAPAIVAKWIDPPVLKKVSSTQEIQELITKWLDSSGNGGPTSSAIDSFKKFLLKCVDPDGEGDYGLDKVVGVMKWWLHLLRKRWPDSEEGSGADLGTKWFSAFREIKMELDGAVKKRFGGGLHL